MNAPSATSKQVAQGAYLRSAKIRNHGLHLANGIAGKSYVALRQTIPKRPYSRGGAVIKAGD
jgi:hypothetical protein